MGDTTITCASVDERDLDTRYLAGTLDEAEAEAFEAHYFGCDRCWGLVRDGQAIRAALGTAGPGARRGARWPHALRLGIAAGLAIIAAGIAFWPRAPGPQQADTTVRGGTAQAIVLAAHWSGDSLTLNWSRVDRAERYRVRLFDRQGNLVLERAAADTTLTLPSAALPPGAGTAEIAGEDRLHQPLGHSDLVPLSAAQP